MAEESGFEIDKGDIQHAIKHNCLSLVQFFHEERPKLWDEVWYAHSLAAEYGHIEMLDYLLANRKCRSIESVSVAAARAGKLDVVKWLMERHRVEEFLALPWASLERAGRTGDWSVFDYVMQHGGHKRRDLCFQAAKWGLTALKKVRRHNVPWYKEGILSKLDLTDEVREYIEHNAIEGDL
jgi:hypothetical protein